MFFFLRLFLSSCLLFIVISVLLWFIRIRPRKPQIDAKWNSDCEYVTTTTTEGSTITFRNVRDFFWRTTRDRDEAWAMIVSMLMNSKISGLLLIISTRFTGWHTRTLPLNSMMEPAFHFRSKHAEESSNAITHGMAFGEIMNCTSWLVLNETSRGCERTHEETRITCSEPLLHLEKIRICCAD